MKALCVGLVLTLSLAAREPLAQRIGHSDPTKYHVQKALHGGPGQFNGTFILDSRAVTPNLQFNHRAIMQPKSGVGAHFHNTCEEMFFIFDGEAQFTIDGRTPRELTVPLSDTPSASGSPDCCAAAPGCALPATLRSCAWLRPSEERGKLFGSHEV